MTDRTPGGFFREMKRRRVFRVAAAYAVVAWIIIEIASVVFPELAIPGWAVRLVILLALLGFPVAIVLAWAFEVTPDGVRRSEGAAVGGERGLSVDEPSGAPTRSPAGRIAVVGAVLVLGLAGAGWWFSHGGSPADGAADRKSIAVLPFANMSTAEDNAYFADGVHEAVLTQLAGIEDLKVISRTSVVRYAGTEKSIREIGVELGAGAVVEGSVQRAGERVRVTAQLIDATTDEHLWAQSYDRDLADVFAIQSEIATEIVAALEAELVPAERERLAARPTEDIDAYDFYLRAREYHNQATFGSDHLTPAARLYERAISIDSTFALAYAGLSHVHSMIYWIGQDRTDERIEAAREAADRALELEPGLPEGHLARGYYHYYGSRNYEAALDEFAVARDGLPNSADVLTAIALIHRRIGNLGDAIAHLRDAVALDPRAVSRRAELGATYDMAHRFDEALDEYGTVIDQAPGAMEFRLLRARLFALRPGTLDSLRAVLRDLQAPADDAITDWFLLGSKFILSLHDGRLDEARRLIDALGPGGYADGTVTYPPGLLTGWVEEAAGDTAAARASYESARATLEARARERPDDPGVRAVLGTVHAALGDREAAVREGRAATELLPLERDAIVGAWYVLELATIHARLGETDRALELIERVVAERIAGSTLSLLRLDPRLRELRDDPRFQAILRRLAGTPNGRSDSE